MKNPNIINEIIRNGIKKYIIFVDKINIKKYNTIYFKILEQLYYRYFTKTG